MQKYDNYVEAVSEDIRITIESMECQPILFFGTGLSIRYANAPSWLGLLDRLNRSCPYIDRETGYYVQKHKSLIDVGSYFTDLYSEWAWEEGRAILPEVLFEGSPEADTYVKYSACQIVENLTKSNIEDIDNHELASEIQSLKSIRPHSVITTNYDRLAEKIFPDYTPIIGEQILRSSFFSIVEIFKIHGCISNHDSIVFNRNDYDRFIERRKYLSAKLLAYFAEHPVLIAGYSATDPNIARILSDIDLILAAEGSLIPNIYLLERDESISEESNPAREKLIEVSAGKSVRVKSISADSFKWVFDAFGTHTDLERVDPRILRSLAARTFRLIRRDLPKRTVDVDMSVLTQAATEDGGLAKLYGIADIDNAESINVKFKYTLMSLAAQLGYNYWHNANELIKSIALRSGSNIKSSDNKYHIGLLNSKGEVTQHRYSDEALALLRQEIDGNEPLPEIAA